jgi:hypothetical protein
MISPSLQVVAQLLEKRLDSFSLDRCEGEWIDTQALEVGSYLRGGKLEILELAQLAK